MTPPTAQLARLLVSLFVDAGEMKRLIRSCAATESVIDALPSDKVSSEEMADAIASTLGKRGLIDTGFFAALIRVRPNLEGEVRELEAAWEEGTGQEVREGSHLSPVRRMSMSTALLAPAAAGALLMASIAFAQIAGAGDASHVTLDTSRGCQGRADPAVPEPQWCAAAPDGAVSVGDEEREASSAESCLVAESEPAPLQRDEPARAVLLSPSEADPIEFDLVSPSLAKKWRVAVSSYRKASAAARELYAKFHEDDASGARRPLYEVCRFKLCQRKCYGEQAVGEVIKPEQPVRIRKECPRAAFPAGPDEEMLRLERRRWNGSTAERAP